MNEAAKNQSESADRADEQTQRAADAGADAGQAPMQPEQEAAALRAELERAQDRALRMQAELENFRRRARRELEDERRYASLPLIRDLLPVMDNLQRAIEAAQKSDGSSGLLEGVQLMSQQLESVLAAHDCRRIEALHQPFDPNLHDAILQQPSAEYPPGTVILVTQVGYQLHDRVVRPAQVIVASEAAQA